MNVLACARKSAATKRRICLEVRDCRKIIRSLIYSSIPGNHEYAQKRKTMLLWDFVGVLPKITSFVERQLRKMTGYLGCLHLFFSVPKVKLRINHQNTVPKNSALDGSVGNLSGRFLKSGRRCYLFLPAVWKSLNMNHFSSLIYIYFIFNSDYTKYTQRTTLLLLAFVYVITKITNSLEIQ